MKALIDLNKLGLFRKANNSDIQENNLVFIINDDNELIKKYVDEVIIAGDDYKAFYADGCRYGLIDLYVLNDDVLLKRNDKLESVIQNIRLQLKEL